MTKRKAIPKKTRFEIFKRDSFTCQYCGQKSPDVLLEIDHIEPVSKGGTNDILNLITSCQGCNSGKSDRQLSDTTVLDKQRLQLENLQERKEQIEMMFQWQKGLLGLDDQVISQLANYWTELIPEFHLNEDGIKSLKQLRRKFEVDEIMSAMEIATEHYLEYIDGMPTTASVEIAFNKVGGVCTVSRREKENPNEQHLYYIRAILRNRLNYVDDGMIIPLLRSALDVDASMDSLETHAKTVDNWSTWRNDIEVFIARQNDGFLEGKMEEDGQQESGS